MKLSLIVAMDRNGLIGKGGGLPWGRIPEDMRHFVEMTKGLPVIVGRRTAAAIPARSDRPIYMVSRTTRRGDATVYDQDGFMSDLFVTRSPIEALARAQNDWVKAVCVGGASLYKAYQGLFTEAHVTVINGEYTGDTWFPFPLLGSAEWEPAQAPVELASGVVYHKLRRRDT